MKTRRCLLALLLASAALAAQEPKRDYPPPAEVRAAFLKLLDRPKVLFNVKDQEAKRDDDNFSYVAAWEYMGDGQPPQLHQEPLRFESVEVKQRSYK